MQILADRLAMEDTINEAAGRLPAAIKQLYGIKTDFHYNGTLLDAITINGWVNTGNVGATSPTLMITGHKLHTAAGNICFGNTMGQRSIISTSMVGADPLRIVVLALHEVGHLLGLVPTDALNHQGIDIFEGHCGHLDCLMQVCRSLDDLDRFADNLTQGKKLCQDCHNYVSNL